MTQTIQDLLDRTETMIFSDTDRAEAMLLEAEQLTHMTGDRAVQARCVMLRASILFYQSRFPEAREAGLQAAELARACGDHMTEVRALNSLGVNARMQGDYAGAMECYLECLRVAQMNRDELNEARVLGNIGVLRMNLGEYEAALEIELQAEQLSRRLGHALAHSVATINIIVSHYHLKQYEQALSLAAQHLPVVRERQTRQHEVILQAYVAHALFESGQAEQAAALAREVLPLAEAVGNQECLVNLRCAYGRALQGLGQLDAAEREYDLALRGAREHAIKAFERDVLGHLGGLSASRGHWQQAYTYSREHQALEQELHAQDSERRTRVLSVQMQLEMAKREAEAERLRNLQLSQANTALHQAQERLAYRATHDAMTDLYNREHFQLEGERLLQTLAKPLGLLFIDLDRFKQINDTLGHDVGDELLKQVGLRLKRLIRQGDLVARLGGDEFTLLLPNLWQATDAEQVAQKVLLSLTRPFSVQGHDLHVTASIGVAVAPQDGRDITTMQKHADVAMYRAKRKGKNAMQTYSAGMADETARRLDLEREMREALRQEKFALHYQGQFDVQRGGLSGFEALARWPHAVHGLIPPDRFIPVAEDSGLIVPLGEWVLREACRQAQAWGFSERALTMGVNVSAVQFETEDFVGTVQRALHDSGLSPACLVVELTESTVLKNVATATAQLHRCSIWEYASPWMISGLARAA